MAQQSEKRLKQEAVARGETCCVCNILLTSQTVTFDHLPPKKCYPPHLRGRVNLPRYFVCKRCNELSRVYDNSIAWLVNTAASGNAPGHSSTAELQEVIAGVKNNDPELLLRSAPVPDENGMGDPERKHIRFEQGVVDQRLLPLGIKLTCAIAKAEFGIVFDELNRFTVDHGVLPFRDTDEVERDFDKFASASGSLKFRSGEPSKFFSWRGAFDQNQRCGAIAVLIAETLRTYVFAWSNPAFPLSQECQLFGQVSQSKGIEITIRQPPLSR